MKKLKKKISEKIPFLIIYGSTGSWCTTMPQSIFSSSQGFHQCRSSDPISELRIFNLGGQLLTDPPDPDAQQCRKSFFPLLSVIPPMPKLGSNVIITDPYLGGQLLTDPPDPDAQQCHKVHFSPLPVIPHMPKYGSNCRITDPYLGCQFFTDPPDPDFTTMPQIIFPSSHWSRQCRSSPDLLGYFVALGNNYVGK
jgi:hypothetical protein